MADSLGQAFVEVRGDTSHLAGDFGGVPHAIHGLAQKFSIGGTVGGIAELGAGFAAALAPIALLEKGIENYKENAREGLEASKELTLAQRRLGAALQATGMAAGLGSEELGKQAEALEKSTGVAQVGIVEFQQRLLAFQNVHGEVFTRATKAALDYSVMMGTDMPSAARMLGIALSDPERGAQRLRRAGVFLTDQQKAQIKAFMEANKLAEAQGVILGALESKFGGAGEKLATPVKKLRAALHEAQIELGKTLVQREPLKLQVKLFVVGVEKELSSSFDRFMQAAGYGGVQQGSGNLSNAPQAASKDAVNSFHKYGQAYITLLASMVSPLAGAGVAKFFKDKNKDYDDLRNANSEDARLRAEQRKMDEKRSTKAQADAGKIPKVDKDVTGVFDLQALQNKIQESLLNKNDKMIALAEESNSIQSNILERLGEMEGAEPAGVAGP